jgi:glycosyltransferase involved in cell wall biosynthesis
LRILFVAMPNSVHAARWINQISDQGWDIHLFSSTPAPVHPDFRNITVYGISTVRPEGLDPSVRLRGLWPLRRGSALLNHAFARFHSRALARLIRRLKPDIIHSMEFQQAGYMTLAARSRIEGEFPTWAVSNWGSDIYLFGRLSAHEHRIRSIMSACDYYHTECHRDVELAREFGFEKEGVSVLPLAGGFDIERVRRFRQPGPTSDRRLIVLKGYQGWAYRALVGLRAIELCADLLKEEGYRVAVYLASYDTQLAAELLSKSTGLQIDIIPHGPHEAMLRLHGRARASIGLSISDALSTSALEAAVMGSFPIQSHTSCIGEMFRDGESIMLVHPEDPESVAAAIRRAVADDKLVNRAADINARIAAERLDHSIVRPQVIEMYERIAARAPSKTGNGHR